MNSQPAQFGEILAQDQKQRWRQLRLVSVIIAVCVAALWISGFFDATRFVEGAPAIWQLASEMMPPNFERWRNWLRPLLDTLAMSIAGTALAVLISWPLSLLAAPNTTPHPVLYRVSRIVLAAFRCVPEIILGILFVAAVGFGALPGVLALALHSVGLFSYLYSY